MILIRSALFFVLFVLNTILFATLVVLTGALRLPYRMRCQVANAWGRTSIGLLGVVCGLRYEIEGWENLPQGNAIILSKHQSAWETIALRGLLPPEQAWVLKRELLWVPFFGWSLMALQPIAIDRKSVKQALRQVLEVGAERLRQGRWVIVFPEGTRVPAGERGKYNVGGAMLAERTGYPVVPVAHNAGVFWARRGIKKYPGTIRVVIGPPIATQGLRATAINQQVEEWIEGQMARLPQRPVPS